MLKRTILVGTVFGAVLALGLPFVGGGGPASGTSAHAEGGAMLPVAATSPVATTGRVGDTASALAAVAIAVESDALPAKPERDLRVDSEHLAQKPVPKPVVIPQSPAARRSGTAERVAARQAAGQSCPGNVGGSTPGAPGITSAGGVGGTTSADLQSFAAQYNAIRVANCLEPVPMSNFRYDACMEARLFWIAEDPSPDVNSAWGHNGTPRSDGAPAVGCDGNLAGGSGNSGATVAQKWWNSASHQKSLYRPTYSGSMGGVVICFAMVHGGLPNDGYGFARAAARWGGC
ncbi:hypothetical protein H4J02_11670 [Protaetiibacter sp. SSC-01]|uniref:hypothetical protein n=1 Tax=Protaetiibacter sp. SSC-01 TaxID=2759943 RepID=UPI001656DF12|nr:hypothetical protein [Protaetiibacter sp. SSC-01]QNO37103.1 hypothetical protein H4J02_11670 [Protaetiibacter sp. SSC-01]